MADIQGCSTFEGLSVEEQGAIVGKEINRTDDDSHLAGIMPAGMPPPPPGPSQGGSGKDQQNSSQGNQQPQEVLDFFGQDAGAAIVTLFLVVLGLMRAAMTRYVC